MDERMSFIVEYRRGEQAMTLLCERYGISRKTGYKWVERYRADPEGGFADRSRAPHRRAQSMAAETAEAIVALRGEHPYWGPRKLRAVLIRRHPQASWPAASTIGDLLRREGLSQPRRRRRPVDAARQPFLAATSANEVWCADFKGWFRTADGRRCDPLTISDAYSRFLLVCQITAPVGEEVRRHFESAFREHGLPRAIRTDNGPPFASTGAGGLSRLSVEWVKLGIRLERIEPGQPQQNGRHERLHRTLKAETSRPPAATPGDQQTRFERFRHVYNLERPHEALGQQTPASFYAASPRAFPDRLEDPWYDADHAVRRIRTTGEIKWGGDFVFINQALAGELVGVAETEAGDWIVRFANIDLGIIDRRYKRLRRFAPARCQRTPQRERTGNTVTHVPGPCCYP